MAYSAIFPITNMIKQVYLILAALMLLCLASMPYGYFQLVRFVAMAALWNLLPKRFVFPSSGTPHSGGINNRVFGEQSLDVLCESVAWVDSVEPVGDIAQVRVKFKGVYVSIRNPGHSCLSRQLWHDRKPAVPDAGMVGALVAQDGDAGQPTAKNDMLRQPKILCHLVFCRMVRKVGIEFRNSTKRQYFKSLPCRWKLWSVVFRKVLCDEIFLRSLNLSANMGNSLRVSSANQKGS